MAKIPRARPLRARPLRPNSSDNNTGINAKQIPMPTYPRPVRPNSFNNTIADTIITGIGETPIPRKARKVNTFQDINTPFSEVPNQRYSRLARYQQKLLMLTNLERSKHGVGPVVLHPRLMVVAEAHNADIAFKQIKLSHVGSDGSRLGERVKRSGYRYKYASENIARGQGSCEHVTRSWLLSPGHRKNLLNESAVHMGVHVGRGKNGQLYWAQIFGKPMFA